MICPRCRQRFPDETGHCPTHQLPLEIDPFIGLVIDRWTLTDHIGQGAMGVVYRAEPRAALKILNARRATMQPDLIRRFEVEATAASRLVSPHVARVHGSGTTEDGHLYIAMDLLSGLPLDAIIERFPRISADGVAAMAYQAAHALAEAHEKHIVHRDLKPANLFVEPLPGRRTHIRVLDFGIARINSASVARSRTGTVAGTPAYMSPEQLKGLADIDGRTDIYSLGVVMYELLAGKNPFRGGNMMDTLRRHLDEVPPPLSADVPPPLASLVEQMLRKPREARPQSMVAVRRQLEEAGLLPVNADQTLDLQTLPDLRGEDIVRALASGGTAASDVSPVDSVPAGSLDPIPPVEPPQPRSRRALWIVGGGVLFAAAVAGGLFVTRPPVVVQPASSDGKVRIGAPERAVPESVVARVIQPDASPSSPGPDDPTAASSRSAAPPREARTPRARRQVKDPRAASDRRMRRLLTRGHKAMESKDYATAQKYYEEWLDEARYLSPPHPQLEVIRNRVAFLRDIR